jgi:hypothetical protein
MRFALAAILAFVAPQVSAQTQDEAQLIGQPLMYMKAGQVDGCGIRFLGAVMAGNLREGKAIDGSVNIYGDGLGAVKAISYDITRMQPNAGADRRVIPLDRFWFKAPGEEATYPRDGQFHKTDDQGGRLYAVKMEGALDLLVAAVTDKVLTIGLKRSGESRERIYFGRVTMTDAEKDQVRSCLDDLIARLSKQR